MHTDEHRIPISPFGFPRRRPHVERAARSLGNAFYIDLLGGREVWPTADRSAPGSRWFMVGDTLIEERPARLAVGVPVQLEVDAPEELLERAWDAGYSVEVAEAETPVRLSIFDPRGRRLDLIGVRRRSDPLTSR